MMRAEKSWNTELQDQYEMTSAPSMKKIPFFAANIQVYASWKSG